MSRCNFGAGKTKTGFPEDDTLYLNFTNILMRFTTAGSPHRTPLSRNVPLQFYLCAFMACWTMTYLFTTDKANWFTENTLTALFLVTLTATYQRFRLSDLSYSLIFVYLLLHIYGAQYTYAENPFGYWLKDVFNLDRNHYDRIVHFSFGFMLAYPMRDFFRNWFGWPGWVCWILPAEITLSFSGMYELIEWAVADVFFPAQGAAYLGSQGDVWDAQKDMGLAFGGAILAMLICFSIRKIASGKEKQKIPAVN
jgi:putative membrane protein